MTRRRQNSAVRGRPGASDGINPEDPGVGLLAAAVRDADPVRVVLVASGPLPGLRPGATRLALDVREVAEHGERLVPLRLEPFDQAGAFEHAVVWPRAHLGKDFSQQCLARGALLLAPSGRLWCAARKQKGAEALAEFMGAVLGNVRVVARDRGYRLMCSERKDGLDEALARSLLDLRYAIADPLLGPATLESAPGLFSRRGLDEGTRALIEHAGGLELQPRVVLDLGCGVAPITSWAAHHWPQCRVLAVDSHLLAVALARRNVEAARIAARVRVEASDGLAGLSDAWGAHRGTVDLALCNPPTHADAPALAALVAPLASWLRPGATALMVVSRFGPFAEVLRRSGAMVEVHDTGRSYWVLAARWLPG
jgi:16S rRNA (guanine1207-N2)-methyltransferase